MRIMVTGGAGFIGSAVVRHLIRTTDDKILTLDKLTYAASKPALEEALFHERHHLVKADIADRQAVREALTYFKPDRIMHLAAETHVDRSIDEPDAFVTTNVVGTCVLLEESLKYFRALSPEKRDLFRFHHVSTDEVFGTLKENDLPFTEKSPYDPRSPYSASKAASDHFVSAWFHTYGFPAFISNTTNNYGPWQFPEKLIPLMIVNALAGRPLPLYGDGSNRRDWIYVEDHAVALVKVLQQGVPGEVYALSSREPASNIDIVKKICRLLDAAVPDPAGSYQRLITFVHDRPGHDFRYEIDPSFSERKLGWKARHTLDEGLKKTVLWYLSHREWREEIMQKRYNQERLGRDGQF